MRGQTRQPIRWSRGALALLSACICAPWAGASQPSLDTPGAADRISIIPAPENVTLRTGRFELRPGMPIAAPGGAAPVARYFSGLLRATRGVALGPLAASGPLVFRLNPTELQAGESYTIEISPDEVVLAAKEPAGL